MSKRIDSNATGAIEIGFMRFAFQPAAMPPHKGDFSPSVGVHHRRVCSVISHMMCVVHAKWLCNYAV